MGSMIPWPAIAACITDVTSIPFSASRMNSLGGGCINAAYAVADGQRRYFIKINDAHFLAMFAAEAAGLAELARPCCLRVPTPICTGTVGKYAFIVLEYLDLVPVDKPAMERLGRGLAMLHRTTRDHFGWERENTIGATPQHNVANADWVEFWRDQRLGFQLHLARREASLVRRGAALLAKLPIFFTDYHPIPSLLHGDLWSGNVAITRAGEPVIFDPAVYYGDREADLAMTELFGGFNQRFYAAYHEVWPLDHGYQIRKHLYNLYHILNHFNLFDGNYAHQAARMMDSLLDISDS